MRAIEQAWIARDAPGLVSLFSPARRPLARAHSALILARLRAQTPLGWALDARCHGRGPDFLIARLTLRLREPIQSTPSPLQEDLWLVYEQGGWWLYSL